MRSWTEDSNGQPYHSLGLVIMPVDKLTLISGTLFLAADIFAVASLSMPDWIVTEVSNLLNLVSLSVGLL